MSLSREILSPVTTGSDGKTLIGSVKSGLLYPALHTLVSQIAMPKGLVITKSLYYSGHHGGERVSSSEDTVICLVCGKRFRGITNTHLEKHNLTLEVYKLMFPEAEMWHTERVSWSKGLNKETDERVRRNYEATRQTMIERYGVDNCSKYPEFMEKMVETRNKTDNYGRGKPKPGTSQKLKGIKRSLEFIENLREKTKLEYLRNPSRRELSREIGSRVMKKLISVKRNGVSYPQRKLYEIVKKVFPDAELEYMVNISKNHNRFLDVGVPSKKLDFEYNGFVHNFLNTQENDRIREEELISLGWTVIKVDKNILKQMEVSGIIIPPDNFCKTTV